MSLILALALSAAPAVTPAPNDQRWKRVVAAAHQMDVPTPRLYEALSRTPARHRTARPLYCFMDRVSDPTTPVKLCRTRADWQALGLEPVAERDAMASRE